MSEGQTWKRCSTCKKDIAFASTYYVCSVSTCNRKRTGMVFCTVECWDQHLPLMRHREAGAVEETAPTKAQWDKEQGGGSASSRSAPKTTAKKLDSPNKPSQPGVRRRIIGEGLPPGPREVLVIASRFKDYIKQVHNMNTSDGVFDVISDELRRIANRAVKNAQEAERKTVLDRDFDFLKRG